MNSYFFRQNATNKDESMNKNNATLSLDQLFLRLCCNCGQTLEKKYNIQKDKIIKPEFSNLYDVRLRK